MKKPSIFYRFFIWLLKALGVYEEIEIDKKEMCKKAIDANVCHGDCSSCAWGER